MKKKYLLNGKIYDEETINSYAQKSGISFDDYLKESGAKEHNDTNTYLLNGKEYDGNTMAEFAQKSNMPYEEYLKEAGVKKKDGTQSISKLSTQDLQSGGAISSPIQSQLRGEGNPAIDAALKFQDDFNKLLKDEVDKQNKFDPTKPMKPINLVRQGDVVNPQNNLVSEAKINTQFIQDKPKRIAQAEKAKKDAATPLPKEFQVPDEIQFDPNSVLDSEELKEYQSQNPIVSTKPNTELVKSIIEKRNDSDVMASRGEGYIMDDIKESGIMPVKDQYGIDVADYSNKRINQIDDELGNIKDHFVNVGFLKNPELIDREKLRDEDKQVLDRYSNLIKKKDEIRKYANVVNEKQALQSVDPTNYQNPSEYYKAIGKKIQSVDDFKNIKNKDADSEKITEDDKFNWEAAGIEASKRNLINKYNKGQVDDVTAHAELNKLNEADKTLEQRHPEVALDNIRKYLGEQIATERKDKDGNIESFWHNTVSAAPNYGDAKLAIKKARQQGIEISPQQEQQILSDLDKIPLTSVLGHIYHGSIAKANMALNNWTMDGKDAEKINSEREKDFRDPSLYMPQQPTELPAIYKKDDGSNAIRMIGNKRAGENNWGWATVNNVGEVTGTILNYALLNKGFGALSEAALGGVAGTEVVGATNAMGRIKNITQLSAEQKNLISNVASSTFLNYHENLERAKEITNNPVAQQAFATVKSLVTGFVFAGINPSKIMGAVEGTGEKKIMENFINEFKQTGKIPDPTKIKDLVKDMVVQTGKDLGHNVSLIKADQIAGLVLEGLTNKKSLENRDLSKEIIGSLPSDVISLIPFSAIAGISKARVNKSEKIAVNDAIRMAVQDVPKFEFEMQKNVETGKITPQDAQQKIDYVKSIAEKLNGKDINNERFSNVPSEKKISYATNLMNESHIKDNIKNMTDDIQISDEKKKAENLQNERKNILLQSELGNKEFKDLNDDEKVKIEVPKEYGKVITEKTENGDKYFAVLVDKEGTHTKLFHVSKDTPEKAMIYGEEKLRERYFDENIKDTSGQPKEADVVDTETEQGIPIGDNVPEPTNTKDKESITREEYSKVLDARNSFAEKNKEYFSPNENVDGYDTFSEFKKRWENHFIKEKIASKAELNEKKKSGEFDKWVKEEWEHRNGVSPKDAPSSIINEYKKLDAEQTQYLEELKKSGRASILVNDNNSTKPQVNENIPTTEKSEAIKVPKQAESEGVVSEEVGKVEQPTEKEKIESQNNSVEPSISSKEVASVGGEEMIGITHAQTDEVAKELGLDKYEEKPETIAQWDEEVNKRLSENKNAIAEMLDKYQKGGKIDKYDQRMMLKYHAALKDRINKNPTPELLKEYSEAKRLSDIEGGREVGKSLVARKGMSPVEDNLANYLTEEANAHQVQTLPQEQISDLKAKFEADQEVQKKLKEATDKIAVLEKELQAKKEFDKIKKSSTKTKKTHEDFVKERKEISQSISEKLKKARSETSAIVVPYAKELIAIAPDVFKMTKSYIDEYVKEGIIIKLQDVIKKVHEELKTHISDIKEEDVRDIIAGQYSEKKKTRNEIAAQMRDLKMEAVLTKKLEDLMNGEKSIKDPIKKQKRSEEIENLKKEIKSLTKEDTDLQAFKTRTKSKIEKLKKDLETGDYLKEPKPTKPVKLDKEAQALQDEHIKFVKETQLRRAKAEFENRKPIEQWYDNAMQFLGLRRIVETAVDLSIPLRQGVTLAFNPRRWKTFGNSFKAMMKSVFSQKKMDRLMYKIQESPNYKEMVEDGISFNEMDAVDSQKRNEDFQKSFVYKIPLIREPLLASNRAADAFLNISRYEMYMKGKDMLEKQGITRENGKEEYEALAKWTMNMTGRGNLLKFIEDSHSGKMVASNTFFGARLMASRFNLLNPIYYTKMPKAIRVEALKDIGTYTAMITGTLLAAKAAGAQVSLDTDDADFLKIKVGDTKYDISGGMVQYIRTFLRVEKAVAKQINPNVSKDEANKYSKFAGGSISNFFRYKLAPNTSYGLDAFLGKNALGEPFDPTDALKIYPMYVDDMVEGWKKQGALSLLTIGLPSILGMGVQTYSSNDSFSREELENKDLKYLSDKGVKLPEFDPKKIEIKEVEDGKGKIKKLSDFDEKKQNEYVEKSKKYFLENLNKQKSKGYVFVNMYDNVSLNKNFETDSKEERSKKKVPIDDLKVEQLNKMKSLLLEQATTKTKKEMFPAYKK